MTHSYEEILEKILFGSQNKKLKDNTESIPRRKQTRYVQSLKTLHCTLLKWHMGTCKVDSQYRTRV